MLNKLFETKYVDFDAKKYVDEQKKKMFNNNVK